MSVCPNSGGHCRCQPQDGLMCPYGPQPPFEPWQPEPADSGVQVEACPFCGNADITWDCDEAGYHSYSCDGCGCRSRQTRKNETALAAWNRRAALPVAPSDERTQFEADAEPMGFDLTRQSVAAVEPWSEYVSEATGHRWAGWRAARALPVAALSDADREMMEQTANAIEDLTSALDIADPAWADADCVKAAVSAIAALRTRLLRHSEGKE